MSTMTESVDVKVPVSTAYNQWTQFESFPHFMEGVEKVEQLDDKRTLWTTKIGGQTRQFHATITSSTPTSGSPGPPRTGPSTPAWSPSTGSATPSPG